MKLLQHRPSYAGVVATLALLMAMGGTAYATVSVEPPNSVNTAAIQDGAVTTPKIADNAVGSGKVKDNTLQGADVKDGSLTGADIANGSIGNAQLGVDSVQAIQIADNSIDGGEIIDQSLTGTDIANGSIGNADLASDSVDSSKVLANSLSLADLVGADINGSIGFSLGANSCGTLGLGVSGAAVGQVVLMSYTGTVAVPPAVILAPMRVTSSGHVDVRACNVASTSVTVSGLGVRIVTFG
jgi:hypothetical protein